MKLIEHKSGFKMYINPDEKTGVSQKLNKFGKYEAREIGILKNLVNWGHTTYDVGANIGTHCLSLSQSVEPPGKIFAFEPSATNYEYLIKNIEINNFTNIIPQKVAVSGKSRKGTLYLCEENTGDHRICYMENRKTEEIDIITLDDFATANSHTVSLIKIDTQGSEYDILKGATKILAQKIQPILFFEYWPKGLLENKSDPLEFLDFLNGYGYTLFHKNGAFDVSIALDKKFEFINIFGFPKNIKCDLSGCGFRNI